jgi:toxin ParE1/3/4
MEISWTQQAISEREAILDYIALANEIAAFELDIRIEAAIERLSLFPESGRLGRVRGTRELVIQGTPYITAYRITMDRVLILTIRHGSRIWPQQI